LIKQRIKDLDKLGKFVEGGPQNDGDSQKADRWMSNLKLNFKKHRSIIYSDEVLKNCMLTCLTDRARTRAVNMGDDSRAMLHYTAAEYCTKLVTQFVNVNHQETAAEEYVRRKQTPSEELMFYLHAKQQLYIQAYPPPMRSFTQLKMDMIKGILKPELRLSVEHDVCICQICQR